MKIATGDQIHTIFLSCVGSNHQRNRGTAVDTEYILLNALYSVHLTNAYSVIFTKVFFTLLVLWARATLEIGHSCTPALLFEKII